MALTREFVTFALNRLAHGPTTDDLDALPRVGLAHWLDEQLAAPEGDDPTTQARLADTKWHIKYAEGGDKGNPTAPPWPAADEMRPLRTLNQPIETLWPTLFDHDKPVDHAERRRPYEEVVAATVVRAVHSRYQLREVMSQFWHDHFNVDASGSEQVSVALPTYDRDVIRRHAFGNFRTLLEAVATSTAMLYYLSNRSSRAGSANENYGRELFELHTLGRDAYLNDKYNRWRDVPGAVQGHPSGYIDQDVYESARAFTGWTTEDGGNIDNQRKLPNTGRFAYVETWHDGYQKRVLGHEFEPFGKAMSDGRTVLDLVATHPATGHFLAKKLCRRLIGEGVSAEFIAKVAGLWSKLAKAPDQIAQVIRFIALSPEFTNTRSTKVKRPLALVASFARATGIALVPTQPLIDHISNAGQRLFGYPAPTGLPDEDRLFVGTAALRTRWETLLNLAQNNWQTGPLDVHRALPAGIRSTGDFAGSWLAILGLTDTPAIRTAVAGSISLSVNDPAPLNDGKRMAQAVAVAAMSPTFQMS